MDRRRVLLIVAAVVAALGLVLVFVWARGADARADARYDTVEVYKAAEPIQLGETFDDALNTGKIVRANVPEGQLLEGYVTVDTAGQLEGQLAAMDIAPGEQVTTAKFAEEVRTGVVLPVPEGMVAQAVELSDAGRVAGFASPGDSVAVLKPIEGLTQAVVVVPEATILGVGSSSPIGSGDAEGEGTDETVENTIVTLALTPAQALDLTSVASMTQESDVTLVIRGDGVELTRGQTIELDTFANVTP
ncbi:pilus assembly protein CpaB [Nocardioides zeae]|uniref:Pilus assembly protein CpaB n=1 Tax=Nocardioides zeae TaxID=1457234 RepID=A0ACC6IH66_9ACTN|nr:RcpC/CpaB family pilus assembly protein [Nocardioides zeae]MDR6173063.1 pilus assembly protein CpaB [Nocardioides zeae]MDR6210056.1 pilus assembly protein CpaB [Nocardioides zeae]